MDVQSRNHQVGNGIFMWSPIECVVVEDDSLPTSDNSLRQYVASCAHPQPTDDIPLAADSQHHTFLGFYPPGNFAQVYFFQSRSSFFQASHIVRISHTNVGCYKILAVCYALTLVVYIVVGYSLRVPPHRFSTLDSEAEREFYVTRFAGVRERAHLSACSKRIFWRK